MADDEEGQGNPNQPQEDYPSEFNYGGLPTTDNSVELTKFVLDPQARQRFEHITKDLATTNLNNEEIAYIDINLRLLHMISYVKDDPKSIDLLDIQDVILQDIYTFLQVTRSKGGFERIAEISKQLKTYQKYEENKEKKGWL